MAESDEPSRADDEIAALRAKYEAVNRRWWAEADTSLRTLALVGYPTRALAYIVGFGLWLAGWYLLLHEVWERPLGSIAVGELVWRGGCSIFWGWIGFNLISNWRSFDEPGHINNLVSWGMLGVAIAVIAGVAGLWLTYG